jgi:hypothetical protein
VNATQPDDIPIPDRRDNAIFRFVMAAAQRNPLRTAGGPVLRYILLGKYPQPAHLATRHRSYSERYRVHLPDGSTCRHGDRPFKNAG